MGKLWVKDESSRLGLPSFKILGAAWATYCVLAARLGPWRAKEAILLCRHYKAEDLLAMGVLNRVVEPADLMRQARQLATTMSSMPTEAIAASKRGINAVFFGQRQF